MQWIEGAELNEWLLGHINKTCRSVTVVSPYITRGGLEPLLVVLKNKQRKLNVTVLTCLDPLAILTGALDSTVLLDLLQSASQQRTVEVYTVTNLHAKVVIVDKKAAVVGSGNMTLSGVGGVNIELGVNSPRTDVPDIQERVDRWRMQHGRLVDADYITQFASMVERRFGGLKKQLLKVSVSDLQIFVRGDVDDEANDYFTAIQETLQLVHPTKGCSIDVLLDSLANKGHGRPDSSTPIARMIFLEYIGVIMEDRNTVTLTPIGNSYIQRDTRALRKSFAVLLMSIFPIVRRVYEVLKPVRKRNSVTYEAIISKYMTNNRLFSVTNPQIQEIQNAVRWLKHLTVVSEGDKQGAKKTFYATGR